MNLDKIDLADAATAYDLFVLKKWEFDKKNSYSLYNRFLTLLNKISDEEKAVVYELMSKMRIVHVEEYRELLIQVMEKIIKDKANYVMGSIYIMPILEEEIEDNEEESKTIKTVIKSGSFLSYLFKNVYIQYHELLAKYKFEIISGFDMITPKRVSQINNSILILPDDFIGSGEQALGMVKRLEDLGVDKKRIIVLTLFIQKEGKQTLRENKIISYEYELINKAFGNSQEDERKRELIKSISLKCGIMNDFLGHKDSEALIVLNRTPNNTYRFLHNKGKGINKNNLPLFPRL